MTKKEKEQKRIEEEAIERKRIFDLAVEFAKTLDVLRMVKGGMFTVDHKALLRYLRLNWFRFIEIYDIKNTIKNYSAYRDGVFHFTAVHIATTRPMKKVWPIEIQTIWRG